MNDLVKEKIGSIEFRLMSPKMIQKMGVVKITTPELYDIDSYPVDGGLMDLRMGVVDPGLRCRTCGSKVKECLGHFGVIELARPVIHIKYINWINNFLTSTCRKCGRILLSDEVLRKYDEKLKNISLQKGDIDKWAFIKEIIKKAKNVKKCPHCEEEQLKIKFDKPSFFNEEGTRLTPIDIRERLERIPDNDLEYLGLNPEAGRPEWMILTLLPVPPVTARPSITLETGAKSEDDLTHKLGDIVRTNQRLYENLNAGAPEIIIEDLWDLLQYHVTTFFTNNINQIPPARHRSGRPLKTLEERIKSKEGRFRKNLAGKRVDFSARTVISPDPRIKINEVGIPILMAMDLTFPETVTEWNIKWLKKFVENGPKKYPGANYVITKEGKRKKITDETKEVVLKELAPGYIVERHLINGDWAIFNRQPSLHKMSMMGHKVKILPYKTFRLNLCVTRPYNADFDGDEMNLHIPQNDEARSEVEVLMNVINNMITPRYGLPIIGAIQDQITGNYLLTKNEVYLEKKEAINLLSSLGGFNIESLPKPKKIRDGKEFWTGKQIFSILLPKDLNFETINKSDEKVVIKKGELVEGTIDAKIIGAGKGILLQEFYTKYGPEKTSQFLQAISLLGINYLAQRGFSVYISDTDLSQELVKKIKQRLEEAENQAYEVIAKYKSNNMEAYPGRTLRETLEVKIMDILNRARNEISNIVEKNLKENPTIVMAESGARGSALNLALIAATVGQQALRGTRINKGYKKRALPHFEKEDLGPMARGFVKHGYKGGLNATEFFFHAMAGRDSMMDTGMRTPKSGYLQRRLVNAMLDLKVWKDGSVRNASGQIVQFEYGDDKVDVTKSKGGKIYEGDKK